LIDLVGYLLFSRIASVSAQFCPVSCPLKVLDRRPERLVITGLRCCMAGYDFGDIDCWETAWKIYSSELGTAEARRLTAELQFWVRTIRAECQRPLELFPHGCAHVCRDECMALSLIAALQDRDCATACLAGGFLTGRVSEAADAPVISAGRTYAEALSAAGQKLMSVPESVVHAIAAIGDRGAPSLSVIN
jgi:hypothetical protein